MQIRFKIKTFFQSIVRNIRKDYFSIDNIRDIDIELTISNIINLRVRKVLSTQKERKLARGADKI